MIYHGAGAELTEIADEWITALLDGQKSRSGGKGNLGDEEVARRSRDEQSSNCRSLKMEKKETARLLRVAFWRMSCVNAARKKERRWQTVPKRLEWT